MTEKKTTLSEDDNFELQQGSPICYKGIEQQIKSLQGKVLQVIEASIVEERHCLAVKKLVKQAFSRKLNHLFDITRVSKDYYIEFNGVGVITASYSDEDNSQTLEIAK